MFAALALAFLVIPFVELLILIRIGDVIGAVPTIGVLVLVSIAGAALVKREGIGIVRRVRRQLAEGVVPGSELVDGMLVILAGAMLVTPGFITDGFGLALLIPPVRVALRGSVRRWLQRRVDLGLYRG